MNTNEALDLCWKHQPELMNKTAQVMKLVEKLYPEQMEDMVGEFNTIFNILAEKTAAVDMSRNLRDYGLAIAGTAVGGLAGAIATDLYDAAKRKLTKGSNFRRIMEVNPNLKREVDKSRLNLAYDALHRYAPDFTADPLIGGALLKQIAELPDLSHKTILDLIGARKDIQDAKGKAFENMGRQGLILIPDKTRVERSSGGKSFSRKVIRDIRPRIMNGRPGE